MGFDLGGLGGVLKVLDFPGTLVGGICQGLGLPPAITDVVKAGVGFFSGDFLMAADGVVNLGADLQQSAMANTCYCPPFAYGAPLGLGGTGYPPCPGYALPPPVPLGGCGMGAGFRQEEQWALGTLYQNFNAADSAGSTFHVCDGKVQMNDLVALSNNPSTPLDLKRAARFFVDNPGAWAQVARSRQGPWEPPFACRGDLQLAMQDLSGAVPYGAPPGWLPPSAQVPGFPVGSPFPPTGAYGTGLAGGQSSFWGNVVPSYGSGPLSSILNMPGMSTEDKVEAVLQQLEDQTDRDMLTATTALNNDNSRLAAIPASATDTSSAQQRAQLQNDQQMLNFELQKLTERRKNLFDVMTTVAEKFNEMSTLAIQNMGR